MMDEMDVLERARARTGPVENSRAGGGTTNSSLGPHFSASQRRSCVLVCRAIVVVYTKMVCEEVRIVVDVGV